MTKGMLMINTRPTTVPARAPGAKVDLVLGVVEGIGTTCGPEPIGEMQSVALTEHIGIRFSFAPSIQEQGLTEKFLRS